MASEAFSVVVKGIGGMPSTVVGGLTAATTGAQLRRAFVATTRGTIEMDAAAPATHVLWRGLPLSPPVSVFPHSATVRELKEAVAGHASVVAVEPGGAVSADDLQVFPLAATATVTGAGDDSDEAAFHRMVAQSRAAHAPAPDDILLRHVASEAAAAPEETGEERFTILVVRASDSGGGDAGGDAGASGAAAEVLAPASAHVPAPRGWATQEEAASRRVHDGVALGHGYPRTAVEGYLSRRFRGADNYPDRMSADYGSTMPGKGWRYYASEGLTEDSVRLIHGRAPIADEDTLGARGITDGATVHWVLRLRAGAGVVDAPAPERPSRPPPCAVSAPPAPPAPFDIEHWGATLYAAVSQTTVPRGSRDVESSSLTRVKHTVARMRTIGGATRDDVARAVLWRGADTHATRAFAITETPLHAACVFDQRIGNHVVCYLLSLLPEGTDVDVPCRERKVTLPLTCAVRHLGNDPDPEARRTGVMALLARGADPNCALAEPADEAAMAFQNYAAVKLIASHAARPFTSADVPQAFPSTRDEDAADAAYRRELFTERWGAKLRETAASRHGADEVLYVFEQMRADYASEARSASAAATIGVGASGDSGAGSGGARGAGRGGDGDVAADSDDEGVRAATARAILWAGTTTFGFHDSGQTPLHTAAKSDTSAGADTLCQLLAALTYTTRVDVLDGHGYSPLHNACAAQGVSPAAVAALLAWGADPHLATGLKRGYTPLDQVRHRMQRSDTERSSKRHDAGAGTGSNAAQHAGLYAAKQALIEAHDVSPLSLRSARAPVACLPHSILAEWAAPAKAMHLLWGVPATAYGSARAGAAAAAPGAPAGSDAVRVVRALATDVACDVYCMLARPDVAAELSRREEGERRARQRFLRLQRRRPSE